MPIHQFRRKPNKCGKKPPCRNRTQDLLIPKIYFTLKMSLDYKAMDFFVTWIRVFKSRK
ncbi:hypothetical protein Hanom_Chr04g00325731 [Helianthus anomalus]